MLQAHVAQPVDDGERAEVEVGRSHRRRTEAAESRLLGEQGVEDPLFDSPGNKLREKARRVAGGGGNEGNGSKIMKGVRSKQRRRHGEDAITAATTATES